MSSNPAYGPYWAISVINNLRVGLPIDVESGRMLAAEWDRQVVEIQSLRATLVQIQQQEPKEPRRG